MDVKSLAQLRAEGKDIQVDPGFRSGSPQMAQRGQLVRVGLRLRGSLPSVCLLRLSVGKSGFIDAWSQGFTRLYRPISR